MNPQEKAHELVYTTFRNGIGVSKYHLRHNPGNFEKSKKCALVCVDEILKIEPVIKNLPLSETKIMMEAYPKFWEEVKNEIKILNHVTTT